MTKSKMRIAGKKKIKIDEIADVKEKNHTVESCIESMETDIEKFNFEAEKEEKITFIIKLSEEKRELWALWMKLWINELHQLK